MEQYLTVKEVASRIKMAEGTVRNLIWRKKFKENIHYVKPTPRKVLFIWSAVEAWLHGGLSGSPGTAKREAKCLITI